MFRIVLYLLLTLFCAQACRADFVVKPYIQLGNNPKISNLEKYDILFVLDHKDNDIKLELSNNGKTQIYNTPHITNISYANDANLYLYTFHIKDIELNSSFTYKLTSRENILFKACAKARSDKNSTFAVFGDLGYGSSGQKKLANNLFSKNIDFALMPGDIVYKRGLIREYLTNYFPIYNNDIASDETGAPLIRSIMFFPALGNHDMALTGEMTRTDLKNRKDALGYFYFFDDPLNGPLLSKNKFLSINENIKVINELEKKTNYKFPKMGNYSFDWGYCHFLILDANPYIDEQDQSFRQFISEDLKKANSQKWKFVVFHQPAYSTDPFHHKDDHLKRLSALFEKYNVNIVFSGHAHNYQRSYPIKINEDNKLIIDSKYDGKENTKPQGVIYMVTGSGGAPLYNPKRFNDKFEPFTKIYLGDDYSYTLITATDKALDVKQISKENQEIDSFKIVQ